MITRLGRIKLTKTQLPNHKIQEKAQWTGVTKPHEIEIHENHRLRMVRRKNNYWWFTLDSDFDLNTHISAGIVIKKIIAHTQNSIDSKSFRK